MSKTFCVTVYKTLTERLMSVCLYFDTCLVVWNKLDSTRGETRKVYPSNEFISLERKSKDPCRLEIELFMRSRRERVLMSVGFQNQEQLEQFVIGVRMMNRAQTDLYRAFMQLDEHGLGYLDSKLVYNCFLKVGVPQSRLPVWLLEEKQVDILKFVLILDAIQSSNSQDPVLRVPFVHYNPLTGTSWESSNPVSGEVHEAGSNDSEKVPQIATLKAPMMSRLPSIALLQMSRSPPPPPITTQLQSSPTFNLMDDPEANPDIGSSSSSSSGGHKSSLSASKSDEASDKLVSLDSFEQDINAYGGDKLQGEVDHDNDSTDDESFFNLTNKPTNSQDKDTYGFDNDNDNDKDVALPLSSSQRLSESETRKPPAIGNANHFGAPSASQNNDDSVANEVTPFRKTTGSIVGADAHQLLPPPPSSSPVSKNEARDESSLKGNTSEEEQVTTASDINHGQVDGLSKLISPDLCLMLLRISLPSKLLTTEIFTGLEQARIQLDEEGMHYCSEQGKGYPRDSDIFALNPTEQKQVDSPQLVHNSALSRTQTNARMGISVECPLGRVMANSLRRLPSALQNEITLFKLREATLGSGIQTNTATNGQNDSWSGTLLITTFRWLFAPSFRPVSELSESCAPAPISLPHAMIKLMSISSAGSNIQVFITLKDCDVIRLQLSLGDVALALSETPDELVETILLPLYPSAPYSSGITAATAAAEVAAGVVGDAEAYSTIIPDITNRQVRASIVQRFKKTVERLAFPEPEQIEGTEGNAHPGFVWAYGRDTTPSDLTGGENKPKELDESLDGWRIFDPIAEYKRLKLYVPSGTAIVESQPPRFRLCTANIAYDLCSTYPAYCVVPVGLTDSELSQVAAHRSRNRFPATVYYHPVTGATITRCAQPNAGIAGNRSREDEKLVKLLREANPTNNKRFYILDLRPYAAALGNQLKGKGTETVSRYEYAELKYLNVENIHAVRDAYEKLMQGCHASATLLQRESTIPPTFAAEAGTKVTTDYQEWLYHVHSILAATAETVRLIEEEGASVLIHCSDGWDRTSQVSALAQLILDPYCRTIRGFCSLIEKEWLSFGHQFALRHSPPRSDKQQAPIFLQFLDCVFQILNQHPTSFNFNTALLSDIAAAMFSSQFGTFLFDCEQQRQLQYVSRKTVSLWTHILKNQDIYKNIHYRPVARLPFCPSSTKVVVWTELYHSPVLSCGTNPSENNRVLQQVSSHQLANLKRELELKGFDLESLSRSAKALLGVK